MHTSFEGKHGSIRYYLKTELDKPWAFNNKLKKLFTVISPIDINDREYLIPITNDCNKNLILKLIERAIFVYSIKFRL